MGAPDWKHAECLKDLHKEEEALEAEFLGFFVRQQSVQNLKC
jgi:hypothetical protein